MSRHERRAMIDRGHHELSVVRQCELLDISRSSAYYSPVQADEYEVELRGLVDKQYLLTPFYGSRKMAVWLRGQGHQVNRKRLQRLMRRMGSEAIYRRPRTTMPDSGHTVYPSCAEALRSIASTRCGQQTSPPSRWSMGSCTWCASWTGTAGTCCRGGCPTPWKPTPALMHWRRR